ncbi:MAG: hypothetical protein KAR87_05660 [Candidatus Aenigmarchaeota archaeon]|nr:hypothetical protein [Candidatus Aenigmarchaeota archaeon]
MESKENNLNKADEEYRLYNTTKEAIHLQNAGESLFKAVKKHINEKYNENAKNYVDFFDIKMNEKDRKLFIFTNMSRLGVMTKKDDEAVFIAEQMYLDLRKRMN